MERAKIKPGLSVSIEGASGFVLSGVLYRPFHNPDCWWQQANIHKEMLSRAAEPGDVALMTLPDWTKLEHADIPHEEDDDGLPEDTEPGT